MCNDKLGKEQGFESPVNAKYLEAWWKNRCTHKSLDQINSQQDLIEFSQKILWRSETTATISTRLSM